MSKLGTKCLKMVVRSGKNALFKLMLSGKNAILLVLSGKNVPLQIANKIYAVKDYRTQLRPRNCSRNLQNLWKKPRGSPNYINSCACDVVFMFWAECDTDHVTLLSLNWCLTTELQCYRWINQGGARDKRKCFPWQTNCVILLGCTSLPKQSLAQNSRTAFSL